jgi:hypothetical protein
MYDELPERGMNFTSNLPRTTSSASTSNTMAATHRATAPMRRPVALPTGAAAVIFGLGFTAPGLTSSPVEADTILCAFFSAIVILLSDNKIGYSLYPYFTLY